MSLKYWLRQSNNIESFKFSQHKAYCKIFVYNYFEQGNVL